MQRGLVGSEMCIRDRVSSATWGAANSVDLTGGVYKARERIHRVMLIRDYQRFRLHGVELQTPIRTEAGFLGFAPHPMYSALIPVSYTHLTLPTILLVQISVVAVSLKKKK
eukprot:TRINITY_DN10999_c0_g2_i1.p1 TRINITY_DN10999_c0_g2~~TRINITY_DN10999_c0_g2_i1.p1  ORF type:complete len:111 (+),score=25.39 TRINITY_DN10999_c0_g2_i1:104-436(+)